jgi:hypothetical protein
VALRCSSLPLAFRCPGSVRTDEGILIDTYHEAATDGTDVHRLLASHPEGDAPKDLVNELSDDARICYYTGAKMWREHISAWMPDGFPEVFFEADEIFFNEEGERLPGDELEGHVDRMAAPEESVVILDWKNGRKDISHKDQGFGYAFKSLRRYKSQKFATVHFAWTRTQELESYTVTRERAYAWAREVRERVINWDGVYHPGDHCQGCKRRSSCPAHAEMNRQSLSVVGSPSLDLATMPGPEMATLYRRLAPLLSQIEGLQEAIRTEVRTRGEVDDGAGSVLHYVEQSAPREVDALKAWPVLTEHLTDEELAGCVKVSIGDVETAVAAKATGKRGAKKAAIEEVQKALDAVGAVKHGKVDRFKDERRKD